MTDIKTKRGYLLPHPNNIAAQDVVRIRETIIQIDNDISKQEAGYDSLSNALQNTHTQIEADSFKQKAEYSKLKDDFKRHTLEAFLNLWE